MKRRISLVVLFILSYGFLTGQTLDSNEVPVLVQSFFVRGSKIIEGKLTTIYQIECTFKDDLSISQLEFVKKLENWQVHGKSRKYFVKEINTNIRDKNKCWLFGEWDIFDELTIIFNSQRALNVNTKDAIGKTTNWGFGKGKFFNTNIQRLADQRAFYAFDYDLKINVLERNISSGGGNIWVRSFSLSIWSKGTFASDDKVRNGTQTTIGFALDPFYFVGGLIYRSEFNVSYQIETEMNETKDKVFDIINKHFKIGAEIEIPLTNYPIYRLHAATGYTRLAMPLIFKLNYQTKGEDINGKETLARFDFQAIYELAFSPYLIIKGEWHKSKFFAIPPDFDNKATYYSLSFAQDLDAVRKVLGFLKFIGNIEEFRGKHFIFLRISKGRRAPAFVDISEISIGFGTYF